MSTTIDDLRERITRAAIQAKNLVRRVTISLTNNDGTWQARGYRGFEGAHGDLNGETWSGVEVFPGIGIWARPKAGTVPEAVIVHIGGEPNHPVIVATRQKELQVALEEDETVIFNSVSAVILKKDGTVEIRTRAGVAGPLATKADLTALKSAISGAGVVANDGGAALKANILAALGSSWPVGTQKLKAE